MTPQIALKIYRTWQKTCQKKTRQTRKTPQSLYAIPFISDKTITRKPKSLTVLSSTGVYILDL